MQRGDARRPLIVVTGSSGLIGSRLLEALNDRYRVAGLDLEPPDSEAAQEVWISCDLTEQHSVDSAFEQLRRDFGADLASVIHLAAYYDFSGEPSPMYRDLTVEGTRRLLRGLDRFQVEHLCFPARCWS
jgi:nucleoside-diphosphate-sugar epimerase